MLVKELIKIVNAFKIYSVDQNTKFESLEELVNLADSVIKPEDGAKCLQDAHTQLTRQQKVKVSRISAQSKVNISHAVSAHIVPHADGYQIELTGVSGKTTFVETSSNEIIAYKSIKTAQQTVLQFNSNIFAKLKPTI